MSNDSQWKTFQPPIMNTDPAILDYKSMSIPSKMALSSPHQGSTYRNGSNPYNGDNFMDSPPRKGSNNFGCNYQDSSPRNGASDKFPPIGTFNLLEGSFGSGEPAGNQSYQQEQLANQGTRETGIIEKLLVSFCRETLFLRAIFLEYSFVFEYIFFFQVNTLFCSY